MVAALQAGRDHSRDGNPGTDANASLLEKLTRDASASKPDLIVFPEYAISGWPYPPEGEINGLGETIPGDGRWFAWYSNLAEELQCALLGWMVERDEGRLYNTAVLIDRHGRFAGKYRKVHANLGEQTWWGWSQGQGFQLLELEGVKLGISICADMWFPETVQCQSLLGADLIIHMSIADDMEDIIRVRAKDHCLPIAAAIFNGGSFFCDAHGEVHEKASAEAAEVRLFSLRPFQQHTHAKYGGLWIPRLGNRNLRQPSAYSAVTDLATRPPWTEVFLDTEGQPQTKELLLKRFNGRYDAQDPTHHHIPMVRFAAPWTSPFRVDPRNAFHLINCEGDHLFVVNKTAWAYFACRDPLGILTRAKAQGVNVLRVALEGTPYLSVLGYDMWPWGGSRSKPDWDSFNEEYWDEVERRVILAGEEGLGIDLVLYFSLQPDAPEVGQQRAYWEQALLRLGKFSNIFTWEIANEYTRNEVFQDAAGEFFKARDPHGRPVCTSDGTTDDAVWPDKPWVDLAINHTCTSSTERHGLREWYQALARNTRSHGKPAFCNESGRENRHKNDDPVHRRKQGWIWCASGGFWTLHSWDGCEGIDDPDYRAPGQEFLKPMADFFRSIPFWQLHPNVTAFTAQDDSLVVASLAHPRRSRTIAYLCTPSSGSTVNEIQATLRLPNGQYQVSFHNPADGSMIRQDTHLVQGLGNPAPVSLPDFTDDLLVDIELLSAGQHTWMEGTG